MGICVSTDPLEEEDEEVEAFRKPKYYRGRDGPKFRVMNFTNHYEYRQYENSTWISARLERIDHVGKALSNGEKILSRYFNGKNGPEKFMELTCPLKLRLAFGKDGDCWDEGEFVASLHLPYENANRPPAPSESGLFIQDVAEHFAYVSSFEGFASEERWQEEIFKLKRILDGEGQRYDKEAVFTTRYENLLHLGKKRNEVIFVVANN